MTTDKAQNIKLEDRDPVELGNKLTRVVELVTAIKGDKADILRLNGELTEKKANLVKNQAELKDLEKEVFVKVRKPRALKPALKNPPAPPKERKARTKKVQTPSKSAGDAGADVIPGKIIDISAKSGVTAPGDPRQAALPIDKK